MYINILSIDTSCHNNLIAILYRNHFYYKVKKCNNNHEKNILSIIHSLLEKYKIKIKDFQFISCTIGPGNFTSTRVGINVAQGLSLPHSISLIGVSNLELLAEQASRVYNIIKIITCVTASKNKVYWGQYVKKNKFWKIKKTEKLIDIQTAFNQLELIKDQWNIIGSGIIFLKNINNKFLNFIDIKQSYAYDLIQLTIRKIQRRKFFYDEDFKVNYLHNPID